jgi:hypothetical protein
MVEKSGMEVIIAYIISYDTCKKRSLSRQGHDHNIKKGFRTINYALLNRF